MPPGAITLSPPVIGYYFPPDAAEANEETLWTPKVNQAQVGRKPASFRRGSGPIIIATNSRWRASSFLSQSHSHTLSLARSLRRFLPRRKNGIKVNRFRRAESRDPSKKPFSLRGTSSTSSGKIDNDILCGEGKWTGGTGLGGRVG